MSDLSLTTLLSPNVDNEKKYIAYLFDNPTKVRKVKEAGFQDINCKLLFKAIKIVTDSNLKVEKDIVLETVRKSNRDFSKNNIELIRNEYIDFENIKVVEDSINDRSITLELLKDVDGLTETLLKKQALDKKAIQDIATKMSNKAFMLGASSTLLDGAELMGDYKDAINERIEGLAHRTLTYSALDSNILRPAGAGEMTLVVGNTGSGKCADFSSLILTDKGFETIGSYSNGIQGFSDTACNLLTKDGMETADKFYEEKVSSYYQVKTNFGYEIKCTDTHPLYTMLNATDFEYVKTADLKEGDVFPLMMGSNVFCKQPQEIVLKDFECVAKTKQAEKNVVKISPPQYLTKGLARLLGYYTANGSHYTNISTNNEKIKDDLVEILGTIGKVQNKVKKGVNLSGKNVQNLVKYLHGFSNDHKSLTARYKQIPKFILEGTRENQIEYLKALIDCDGYFAEKKSTLEYFTASWELAKQVQLIFQNLGIFTFIRSEYLEKYDWDYYTVHITSEDLDKYIELIGDSSLKYTFNEEGKKRNTNVKRIPFVLEYINGESDRLRKRLDVRKNGKYPSGNTFKRYKLGNLKRLVNTGFSNYSLHKIYDYVITIDDYNDTEEYQNIISVLEQTIKNNYVYDTIKSVELIEESLTVCDFNVPVVHNFVCNGLINHNSIFCKNIENKLINQGTCVLSVNLEMGKIQTVDRLFSVRHSIPMEDLINPQKNPDTLRKIELGISKFEKLKNYTYFPESFLTLDGLDNLIAEAKIRFKNSNVLPKDDYMVVVVDLLTMIKEFSGASPAESDRAVDTLNEIIKRQNIHLIAVVQANENKFRGGKLIKNPEDLDFYKIGLEDIKGASALAQRSRVVLSLNRPLLLKKHFFPELADEWAFATDLIKLNCIKQNDSSLFTSQFILAPNMRIFEYIEE